METILTYGFDPALRHGALIWAEFQYTPHEDYILFLEKWGNCYSWVKRDEESIGLKSPPEEVYKLGSVLISSLQTVPYYGNRNPNPIAIDWDPQAVYWRTQKRQLVQMAFLMGYFTRGAQTLGHPVIMIPPKKVRSLLGVGRGSSKAETWRAARERLAMFDEDIDYFNEYEDHRDALILAALAAEGILTDG